MTSLRIADRTLGPGLPALLAAEIGINHNGDMALAHKAIDAAADAGADAVKFQNYRTSDFLSDRSLTHEYVSRGERVVESQWDMFRRCELTRESLGSLRDHCLERRVIFFSTPSSAEGVDDLVRLGVPMLKNASDSLNHFPLIRAMARSGLPTLLSTGMATAAEVDDGVRAFRTSGGRDLMLLLCTSSYPTPAEEVNLRKIPVLAAAFGCAAGFSDHTWGVTAAVGAVALGACMVEKHFTIDKGLPGPDHRFSSDPAEFRELVNAVRTVEKNLGTAAIGPTASEALGRRDYRLSCVAVRALPAGHHLTADDVALRRPGTGLPPAAADWLVGHRLERTVEAGHAFTAADFS